MPYPQEIEIMNRIREAKAKKRSNWPVSSNRASELGHPCLRYLVYNRTIPAEKKALCSVDMQFIFDGGRHFEIIGKEYLQEAGFQTYDDPKGKHWQKYNITGNVDTRIKWEKQTIPVEIKGINHYLWAKLAKDPSIDAFWKDHRPWVNKYPGQLLIYCILHNVEEGLFLLVDKLTLQPLVIWLYAMSYLEYGESLVKKAELINKHIEKGTLPDRITNLVACESCAFQAECLPDLQLGDALQLSDDTGVDEDMLKRREELHKAKSEYEALDKEIKNMLKPHRSKKKIAIGDFVITWKEIEVTDKPREGRTYIQLRTEIKHLGQVDTEPD